MEIFFSFVVCEGKNEYMTKILANDPFPYDNCQFVASTDFMISDRRIKCAEDLSGKSENYLDFHKIVIS